MMDLVVALGLVLVLEGLLWAIAPLWVRRMLEASTEVPENALRLAGTLAVAAGVVLVWAVRG